MVADADSRRDPASSGPLAAAGPVRSRGTEITLFEEGKPLMQNFVIDQPVIETERLVLRPPRRSDAGLISLYAGDRRVAEGTRSIPHPLPPGFVEAYIGRALAPGRAENVWIMDGSGGGASAGEGEGLGGSDAAGRGHEVLGVLSLTKMDRNQSQLGYWVAPAFWNTGFASEAVRGLIAANPCDCGAIFAEVFQDNPASARVLTNAGFAYIGDAEAHALARGANVATWTYIRRMG